MNEPSDAVKKALSMLGLARAAGALSIGQDQITEELRRGKKLVLFVTEETGASAMRRFAAAEERGAAKICRLENTGRLLLGRSIGVTSAQAAALPAGNGFADKIISILSEDRSDANE